jgi:acyl carrier protein
MAHDVGRTPEQIQHGVEMVIAAMAPRPGAALAGDTDLRSGLGYNSLRLIELMIALERHLGLPPVDMAEASPVRTVGDVIEFATRTASQAGRMSYRAEHGRGA